ncbi:hypothetical protein [Mycolicibacterium alvei]|nr:hypothetical protein [Mycolicibacterium alvei]MCV7003556.1 hypothetical protein [Mycolicibacterium alvei]
MASAEFVEQPPAGFNYTYWFTCPDCAGRINTTTLEEPVTCACGAENDTADLNPVLRDPNDVALRDDLVASLIWYHTSRYENWPDRQAYAAETADMVAEGFSYLDEAAQQQIIEQRTSFALHLGTYEAAIENMLRRLSDQDPVDRSTVRYWLHRVHIHLAPNDLHPHVGDEIPSYFGEVPLSELDERGARAVRYVNIHEAHGSVSLAIHPDVIATVASIALPLQSLAPETPAAADATTAAAAALSELEQSRPDTTGIDRICLRFRPMLDARYPDPHDPERQRIATIADQLDDYENRHSAIWSNLTNTLEAEYLPHINGNVRERFHHALRHTDDPAEYHRDFQALAALLTRPTDVLAELDTAPVRTLRTTDHNQ